VPLRLSFEFYLWIVPLSLRCQGYGVPLSMSRTHPECPDSVPSDLSVAADVVLRQEPDEEGEGDGKEDNDDDDNDDDGYSE
jgi:hypothetical protein